MKVATLTQTYQFDPRFCSGVDGRDRSFLLNYLSKDLPQLKLRSLADLQTYNFHNYNIDDAKKISSNLKSIIPDIKCTVYNNMTLGQSLFAHIEFLKMKDVSDVLWIQDDEFSLLNEKDLEDIFIYYKTNNVINLSLCRSIDDLDPYNIDYEPINENITVFKSSVVDFTHNKKYAMDFSAFICNINVLYSALKNIDISTKDAYKLEGDFSTFISSFGIPRYVLNKPAFKTFNIVGMVHSLGEADKNYEILQKRFANS